MQTLFKPKLIALAALSVYALPFTVEAEEQTIQTETIEVISTTPLQGIGLAREIIPANIQTITSEDIEEQNSLSIADHLSSGIQGVTVNEIQNNPYQPTVNFRGFTASPLLGAPQGISVFVDGVRVNEPFGDVVNWDLIPLNAISGINLIPGSNPVFGLNTLGGALSVQTKSGRTHQGGAIDLQGGSWGRISSAAEFGGVTENGIDFFVAGNLFHEQGWRDFSPSDVRQAFGKIGWQGDTTDANLSLTLADNELVGNGLVQKDFLSQLDYESINTKPDATDNTMAFLNFNLNHYFDDDTVLSTNAYYRTAETKSLNGDVNDDIDTGFAGFDLANCVAGADEDDAEAQCGGALNRSESTRDSLGLTAQMAFNQDFWGKKNQFITGFGYDYGRTEFEQNTEFGTINSSRGVDGIGVFGDEGEVDLKSKTQTYSIFATDTLSLSNVYHLTLAARYNYTDVKNRDGFHDQKVAAGEPDSSLNGDHSFSRINPAIGLSFTPTKNFSAYASYNEGSRAPTAIELGCANRDEPCNLPNAMAGDPPLDQVVAKTFEVGVRGSLTNGIGYSASVYRTQNTNDIQFIAANSTGAGYFDNVGKTRREGFDLGLNGKHSDFRWSASYSYIKATYRSDFSIANEGNSSSVDTNSDGEGDTINVSSGDSLAGIPQHQLKLRGVWQATPNWSIGTNIVTYADQYSFGNENNKHQGEGAKVSGYTIVNLDTRYNFNNTGWQLFGRVNNIFDKEYYSAGMLGENYFDENGQFDGGDDEEAFLVAPGAPVAAWIGVRYEFGRKK